MLLDQAENFISEYAGSEHFLFLNPIAKQHAEPVLMAFFKQADEIRELGFATLDSLKARDVEDVLLNRMPHLNLPVDVKKAVPDLLEAFFGYLKDSGRFPPAGVWRMVVEGNRKKFLGSLREDGSVKGQTFKKQYTDVGRNDPCPCGSGKKFKKCCMPLIA